MKRLLAIVVLSGCAGSLVDSASLSAPGGGASCSSADTCPAAPLDAVSTCIAGRCSFECQNGKLKGASGCGATKIAAGTSHTCAVVAGEAQCWGSNDAGQLGHAGGSSFVPVKVDIPGTLTVTAIAAGYTHTCAIASGDVWCWGDNTSGQLGIGSSGAGSGGPKPKQAAITAGALQLAAGGSHTCYANANGLFCWGSNAQGEIGDGSMTARLVPTPVTGVIGPSTVAAGANHTCAIAGGGVMCWGANDAGQLGIGSGTGSKSTPERTSPNLAASFLGLGANHSCADDGSGVLFCWGANASFQIDDIGIDQRSPKSVVSDASGVAGGIGHTCAIRVGRVTCWGLNDKGQLGSGAPGHEPVEVSNLSSVSAIAASYKHTCAIDAGTVKCWGLNDRGQLGGPSLGDFSAAPVLVSGR